MRYRALATDFDGTLAHHAVVELSTLNSLEQLRSAGAKLLLVTGRELPDLFAIFTEHGIFDLIVAENGALLYWPETKSERLLAKAPPREFAERLRARGVNELSVGRVIVATMQTYISTVEETINELKLPLEVILNKGALMVLPKGVDKGSGLAEALRELGLDRANLVAVGDAENDQSLLRAAGCGVAVANALPLLKEQANWVTPSDHGSGVRELIDRMLADSIPSERAVMNLGNVM